MQAKVFSLQEAVDRYIERGDSIVMGACLEPVIPFAAAYECLRQNKKELTLIAPISDILFDMMIGAGAVSKLITAWSGNVSVGLGYNYRRSIEKGIPNRVEIEDHSNFSLGLALLAGAMGVPFLPMKSLLGSDLLKSNPSLKEFFDPYTNEKLVYVPALNPDVAVIGAQRSDEEGNAHLWGNIGLAQDAALASKKVIILAEEIVTNEVIISDPNRILIPGFKITAVVHCPGFSHPSPLQGFYKRDHSFFHEYHEQTKDVEDFNEWLKNWVLNIQTHEQYIALIGDRFEELKIREKSYAAPVNYAAH